MLRPDKHTKLKYSIIYISGLILKTLQNEVVVKYDELKEMLVNRLGIKAKSRLNLSLTFLYSIEKIKYLKDLDAITIINNETVNENN